MHTHTHTHKHASALQFRYLFLMSRRYFAFWFIYFMFFFFLAVAGLNKITIKTFYACVCFVVDLGSLLHISSAIIWYFTSQL